MSKRVPFGLPRRRQSSEGDPWPDLEPTKNPPTTKPQIASSVPAEAKRTVTFGPLQPQASGATSSSALVETDTENDSWFSMKRMFLSEFPSLEAPPLMFQQGCSSRHARTSPEPPCQRSRRLRTSSPSRRRSEHAESPRTTTRPRVSTAKRAPRSR